MMEWEWLKALFIGAGVVLLFDVLPKLTAVLVSVLVCAFLARHRVARGLARLRVIASRSS